MLVVIYPDFDIWNFVLQPVKGEIELFKFIPFNRYCNKFQRIFRRYCPTTRLPPLLLFGKKLRKILKSLRNGDSVVLCDYTGENIVKSLKQLVRPDVRVSLWYWNPVLNNPFIKNQILTAKNLHCDIYTFNRSDADEYSLKLLNQFFPMFLPSKREDIITDFYFQGYDKGRKHILKSLEDILNKYNTVFNIVTKPSETITYNEYIQNVRKTKCLIDIVQDGQNGITLRPLEALSLRKKLITNNHNIQHFSFYKRENIFILGLDDIATIDNFINSSFVDVDINIKREYDTFSWITNFNHYV